MKKHIASINKNSSEIIKVELSEFNGHDLLGVRVWMKDTDRPTAKGITVGVKLIPDLIGALRTAEAEARAAGLL